MRTLGIDLAAEPKDTGSCAIRWSATGAEVESLSLHRTDEEILAEARQADVMAIDAPFGWPDTFVKAVLDHHGGAPWPVDAWRDAVRRKLRLRATDEHVYDRTGLTPLSVSADSIAIPAMRCAGLLTRLGVADRSGDGRVFEAYPASALSQWGYPCKGYKEKKGADARRSMIERLRDEASWLSMDNGCMSLCVESDDALDAVVCALVARAAARGLTEAPPAALRPLAAIEGWIALPHRDSLARLPGA